MILLAIFAFGMVGIAVSSIQRSERSEWSARVRRQKRAFRRELKVMRTRR